MMMLEMREVSELVKRNVPQQQATTLSSVL